jgi:hypothetical protein
MKKILMPLVALGLALSAAAAWAQTNTAPPAPPEPAQMGNEASPPRPEMPGPPHKPMDEPGRPEAHWHLPPSPSKAAHFRLKRGETDIDVKCADDEPTNVCTDAAIKLMNNFSTMAR